MKKGKSLVVLSYGPTKVWVATAVGLLMGTAEGRAIVLIWYSHEGFKTLELMSKGGDHLVGSDPLMVGVGTGVASGATRRSSDLFLSTACFRLTGYRKN